jgi:acetyltransferase
MKIERLDAAAAVGARTQLVGLLLDALANGASMGLAAVQKMMVHSRVRRRGIGSVLLRAVEAEALALGRELLFLDIEAGSGAEQLYRWLGYTCVGEVPDYATSPGGQLRPAAIYYKNLLSPELA